jgi:hypothetical protein
MAEDESKPRRFAWAASVLRMEAHKDRALSASYAQDARDSSKLNARGRKSAKRDAEHLDALATECETAADLLEAAESEEP